LISIAFKAGVLSNKVDQLYKEFEMIKEKLGNKKKMSSF
jgi:hypothetical protein